ncbi:hypothetical protein E2C01_053300 [Portunus trituberculatus]|uniref:Uncharacterized protein n=1 Tax=Portunus trituberculatus TaxID=210409 RepID=A0A5B7GRN5_PORTR|nr:hypothetical protein [Portunus trituberculatus]
MEAGAEDGGRRLEREEDNVAGIRGRKTEGHFLLPFLLSARGYTLFFLAIDDIASALPHGVRSSLYVDDFAIYGSGSSSSFLHTTDHGF